MSFKVIHPASRLEWWLARSQLYGQSLVDSVVGEVWRLVGLSVSRVQWYGKRGWGERVREERGVIRYHWRLIPRLLQTKSDSMLDGGWQREGNKHK